MSRHTINIGPFGMGTPGLFLHRQKRNFYYLIGPEVYDASTLNVTDSPNALQLQQNSIEIPEFPVDPQGSELIALLYTNPLGQSSTLIIFQEIPPSPNLNVRTFVKVLQRVLEWVPTRSPIEPVRNMWILKVPKPWSGEGPYPEEQINGRYPTLPLVPIDSEVLGVIHQAGDRGIMNQNLATVEQEMSRRTMRGFELSRTWKLTTYTSPSPRISGPPPISTGTTPQVSGEFTLFEESFRTLLSQLYGIPVTLPKFLIINGLRMNFIPFQDAANMLSQNQIERYIIDPLIQPWAGAPPARGTPPDRKIKS